MANRIAVLKTSKGTIRFELFEDQSPKTAENFRLLAERGYYDGVIFHRVIKGFMIQGGDPLSKDPAKEEHYGDGGPSYKIKAEFNQHTHQRGVISMAREQDPDSAGSQFFICLGPVPRLDGFRVHVLIDQGQRPGAGIDLAFLAELDEKLVQLRGKYELKAAA